MALDKQSMCLIATEACGALRPHRSQLDCQALLEGAIASKVLMMYVPGTQNEVASHEGIRTEEES